MNSKTNHEVGNTPFRHLPSLSPQGHSNIKIFAKLESENPTGSIKDRIAEYILGKAHSEGALDKITTIVEASSGNTAASVAFFAARRGLKSVIFVPEKTSREKVELTEKFGAKVIRVSLDRDYMQAARDFSSSDGCYYLMDQYENPWNREAHYKGIGQEIIENMRQEPVHAFVAAGSTGGTISGVGALLKAINTDTQIILADPRSSVLYDKFYKLKDGANVSAKDTALEGVGKRRVPGNMIFSVVDRVIKFSDKDAVDMIFKLTEYENLSIGLSSGANALVASMVANEYAQEGQDVINIVTVFPDAGWKYESKLSDQQWLNQLES